MLIENFILLVIMFYITSTNLMVLLYTGGLYLCLIGLLLSLYDIDVYIGFLWVIDLGVGLIFFIFILHFSTFLYQKSTLHLTFRYFMFITGFYITMLGLYYFIPFARDHTFRGGLGNTWVFRLTYTDFYNIYNTFEVTELNLLRDSYFFLNNWEFIIVNFSLFYGLITAVILGFSIQRIFAILHYSQYFTTMSARVSSFGSNFFMRQQNYVRQQNTAGVTKVWSKSKTI